MFLRPNVTCAGSEGPRILRPVLPTYCPSLQLNGMFIQNTEQDADDNANRLIGK